MSPLKLPTVKEWGRSLPFHVMIHRSPDRLTANFDLILVKKKRAFYCQLLQPWLAVVDVEANDYGSAQGVQSNRLFMPSPSHC